MSNAFTFGAPSRHDIFLSPHSDDVCFSIGFMAHRRRAGTLLTLFPVSTYRTDRPQSTRPEATTTTRDRIAEDLAFGAACGLAVRSLQHGDAVVRDQHPFDAANVPAAAKKIEASLMRALVGPTLGREESIRPWLFCPAGIGGHVDHLAALLVVARNLPGLVARYRVAFYEDLHYASDAKRREHGIRALHYLLRGHALARYFIDLAEPAAQAAKMELVRIYGTQLTPALRSIEAFTPALPAHGTPHEGFWVLGGERHHSPA